MSDKTENKLEVNMYEFNKVNMAQVKPLDPIWLNRRLKEVAEYMYSENCYWMLLCRERNDYTVFALLGHYGVSELSKELSECLLNRGLITDFTQRDDGNYEIWIRDQETKENFVYYLFKYNEGIIEV